MKCEGCGDAVSLVDFVGQCENCGGTLTASGFLVPIAIGMQDFSEIVNESSAIEDATHIQMPEAFAREDLIRVS